MKKIPTIFERDWDGDRSRVTDKPTAALEACRDATPTVKWDGTAVMIRDGKMFKRYTRRKGKQRPSLFEACTDVDPKTGKQEGWLPVGDGPEDRWCREAWDNFFAEHYPIRAPDGTYELVGPKVQGNPYGLETHELRAHGALPLLFAPLDYEGLRRMFEDDTAPEGIVWWKDGEPVGKIKRRDFGLPWPVKQ